MADTMLETPYVLATLPKPLDSKYGRIQSAPVHSIRGSKKRKRQEIVAGIDGESVNIYDVTASKAMRLLLYSLTNHTDSQPATHNILRLASANIPLLPTMLSLHPRIADCAVAEEYLSGCQG